MRSLLLNETQAVCGANAADAFGMVGGAVGIYYGAVIGASIATPFSFIGLMFALTSQGGVLWSGVMLSVGLFAAGGIGGGIVGGLVGSTVGVAGGMVTDSVLHAAQNKN